ncbi:1-phosphatidylinositol 4,5-bisphosphate phosphodiesterase 1 [Exophiala dermatitidis]
MPESTSSMLSSRLANLNPFSRSKSKTDEEDLGEKIDPSTIAGGGHGARSSEANKDQLQISHALRSFLVHHNVISKSDAALHNGGHLSEPLQALLNKPYINVPPYITDRSHPLPEYFISSSHNTYLNAHQLYGDSSAIAYQTALSTGSRCVEIDAWDDDEDKDEPKVTHGYTLVSHISFRSVCETIRDTVDSEAAQVASDAQYRPSPILVSLENHCSVHGQRRLVQIMKDVWGDRLLSEAIRAKGHEEQTGSGSHVRLEELGSKIVVIVEYHFPGEPEDDESSSSDDTEEETRQAQRTSKEKKKAAPSVTIIPELAELGIYAQSVKPKDNSWYAEVGLKDGPHHHLINISETALRAHLPAEIHRIARHNAQHLMRVYPKGTRVSSKNLNPVPFWGLGAQICALNWQTFGAGLQLNQALFSGTEGYVLKPAALRAGGNGVLSTGQKKRLRLHVAGASGIPLPEGRKADDITPYLSCTLIHPDDLEKDPVKRKTAPYKHHKLGFLHEGENPPATDPVWDETLEWEYEDNELAFLRMLIKSDDSYSRNPVLAVAAVRLMYVVPGWSFIRMLDLKGRETTCSLLIQFEIDDV